ncbi:MAG: ROK family protein, partial [Anaerolineae bacterium]
MDLFGGIEAGGTKFVCAVGSGPEDIVEEIRFPTTTPEETIGKAIDFFRSGAVAKGGVAQGANLRAVGIASFGPVDPNPRSPTWGYITSTPKAGWGNTDFAGQMRAALGVPVGFDTDVNGAALGEGTWGAAQG